MPAWLCGLLYMMPQSKPISGGIPHCFPQFGPGDMQQHGFGRNLDWAVSDSSSSDTSHLPKHSLGCRLQTDGTHTHSLRQCRVTARLQLQMLLSAEQLDTVMHHV